MAAQLVPLVSTVLLTVLLAIGLVRRIASFYPMFYSYVSCVVALDAVRLASLTFSSQQEYVAVYWCSQFLSVAFGFGVIWEVYGLIFKDFPGTERMAKFLVSLALGFVLLNALIQVIFVQP